MINTRIFLPSRCTLPRTALLLSTYITEATRHRRVHSSATIHPTANHYQVLGLEHIASDTEIKSAYYRLSMIYHPDRNKGSSDATEKFQRISEAYNVLRNPNLKAEYDRNLADSHQSSYYRMAHKRGTSGSTRSGTWRSPDSASDDFDSGSFKSGTFRNRSSYGDNRGPRPFKSNYYNFDEHFKMHYSDQWKRTNSSERDAAWARYERVVKGPFGSNPDEWASRARTEWEWDPEGRTRAKDRTTTSHHANKTHVRWSDMSEEEKDFVNVYARRRAANSLIHARRLLRLFMFSTFIMMWAMYAMR